MKEENLLDSVNHLNKLLVESGFDEGLISTDEVVNISYLNKVAWFLPKDFRNFLKYVGDRGYMISAVIEGREDDFSVEYIKGINGGYSTILEDKKMLKGRIPKRLIPFADGPFGNLYVISVRGKDKGSVYYWDHELEYDEEQDDCRLDDYFGNLTKLANSFTEFVSSLKYNTDMDE